MIIIVTDDINVTPTMWRTKFLHILIFVVIRTTLGDNNYYYTVLQAKELKQKGELTCSLSQS